MEVLLLTSDALAEILEAQVSRGFALLDIVQQLLPYALWPVPAPSSAEQSAC